MNRRQFLSTGLIIPALYIAPRLVFASAEDLFEARLLAGEHINNEVFYFERTINVPENAGFMVTNCVIQSKASPAMQIRSVDTFKGLITQNVFTSEVSQ